MGNKQDGLVTIIVPMFNVSKYIERCIKSLKKQSYINIEVLLIDDGSVDDTVEISRKLTYGDKRFKIITKRNTGVSDSRNIGISKALGEFITFVDSDDWIEAEYIEKLKDNLIKNEADISCCGYYENYLVKENKKLFFEDKCLSIEEALDVYSPYYFTTVWGKMFKKEIFKSIRFKTDIYYSEDTLLYTESLLVSNKVYWSSEPLYHYFINENGSIKKKNPEKYYTDFIARRIMLEYYEKYPNLYEDACFRVVDSAISVKKEILLDKQYNNDKIILLDEWINKYKNKYLKSKKVSNKNKILLFITNNNILLNIYSYVVKLYK